MGTNQAATRAVAVCLLCGFETDPNDGSITEHVKVVHRGQRPALVTTTKLDGKVVRPVSCAACAGPVFADQAECRYCGQLQPRRHTVVNGAPLCGGAAPTMNGAAECERCIALLPHGRTRSDDVVVAIYCSLRCAEAADEPAFGPPWRLHSRSFDDLRHARCTCGNVIAHENLNGGAK